MQRALIPLKFPCVLDCLLEFFQALHLGPLDLICRNVS